MWTPQHMRKIFIGGLDYSTTNETLQEHFAQYGEIIDSIVMKDPATQRSRGFGFITFVSPDHVDSVQKARPHKVDGKLVETKRAVPRTDIAISSPGPAHGSYGYSRLFIGGLPQDVNEAELEQYFKHFGDVTSVTIMYEKGTDRHRGFAFVDFSDYDHVDKVLLTHGHTIKGRPIDVKKAIKKGEINKMKSLISGISKSDAATLAATGLGKLARGVAAPAAAAANLDNANSKEGDTNENSAKNASNGNNVDPSALNDMMKLCLLRHPCMPRVPFSPMPGFSAQLPSGWQYTVSNNAEVLRNTGIESDGDSDASIGDLAKESTDSLTGSNENSISDAADVINPGAQVLFIEPFYGGSHSQLIDTIRNDHFWNPEDLALLTLPAKKWHWKARTSALYFYQKVPQAHNFKILFASSTLNLCELLSLRPDLNNLKKVLYFHENQLVYPIRKQKTRDFQYGYNQILSSLVADVILFNSQYNLESFVREIPRFLKQQPGSKPDCSDIVEKIKLKGKVLYYPVNILHLTRSPKDALEPLHIIWPHRWEHDKDPETFFNVLFQLAEAGLNFKISVLGESFSEIPPIFTEAKEKLSTFITHWGYEKDKERYWEILHTGDVVVSTAHHEFFGVSMLEAVGAGCFPLCPNRLVYPEIYSQDCLYNTTEQLQRTLGQWCSRPQLVRSRKVSLDLNSFSWQNLRNKYIDLLSYTEPAWN